MNTMKDTSNLSKELLSNLLRGTQELIEKVENLGDYIYDMYDFDACILGVHYEVSRRSWNETTHKIFGVSIHQDGDTNYRNIQSMEPEIYQVSTLITARTGRSGEVIDDYDNLSSADWLKKAYQVEEYLKNRISGLSSS